LARAQDFVVSGGSGGVSLRDLIDSEVSAFAAQTEVQGIPLVLGSAFAQQFALVVHELATNAAKYGSLSIPNGRLLVRWEIKQETDVPTLIFSWRERDGPLVRAPTEAGFGNELIAATLSRAPVISYNGSGLEFAVEIPLSDVMTTGATYVPD
jgi:two-component sensor histidine kinase